MGCGVLRFTVKAAKEYPYLTKKPWKELEGKEILHHDTSSYTVLEDVSDSPTMELDTGRSTLNNILAEFLATNESKRPWNPWYWFCYSGSSQTDHLSSSKCKKLLDIWDDLWEFSKNSNYNSHSDHSDTDDSDSESYNLSDAQTIYIEGKKVLEYAVTHSYYVEIYIMLD